METWYLYRRNRRHIAPKGEWRPFCGEESDTCEPFSAFWPAIVDRTRPCATCEKLAPDASETETPRKGDKPDQLSLF